MNKNCKGQEVIKVADKEDSPAAWQHFKDRYRDTDIDIDVRVYMCVCACR